MRFSVSGSGLSIDQLCTLWAAAPDPIKAQLGQRIYEAHKVREQQAIEAWLAQDKS
jgi:hypothetical protein